MNKTAELFREYLEINSQLNKQLVQLLKYCEDYISGGFKTTKPPREAVLKAVREYITMLEKE